MRAIWIDGANVYATCKTLGIDLDWAKLRAHLKPTRSLYFTAVKADEEYSTIRPLLDWLDYNGFTVISKPTKEYVDSMGRRKIKGNMDMEIAVSMMELSDHCKDIILMTGDGDFSELVAAVQRRGCHVTVISTIRTDPAMCADELRRQADMFIDMADLATTMRKVRAA